LNGTSLQTVTYKAYQSALTT